MGIIEKTNDCGVPVELSLEDSRKFELQFMEELKKNNFVMCKKLFESIKTINFGNININSTELENPLITMSILNNMPAVKFLVEELGANVNHLSINNTTAIMYAFQVGNAEIVAYLFLKGALTETHSLTETKKMTDYYKKEHIQPYMNLMNFFITGRQPDVINNNQ